MNPREASFFLHDVNEPLIDTKPMTGDRGDFEHTASFDWVTPQIATGGAMRFKSDMRILSRRGVKGVVSGRRDFDDALLLEGQDLGIRTLTLATPDDGATKPTAWFKEAIDFCLPILRSGGKVYLHCFLPGTLVGAEVPVPIEQVEGEVIAHDGSLRKVVRTYSRDFKGNVTTLNVTGTLPLTATPNHKVLVLRAYRWPNGKVAKPGHFDRVAPVKEWYAREPEWVRADEVQAGDYLLSARWTPEVDTTIDPEVAWALGFFVADGNADSNGITYTLSLKDDHERLTAALAKMGYRAYVSQETETWRRLRVNSREAARLFTSWFGTGSQNKHLPGWLMHADPAAVVSGVMAGDGHVLKNRTGSRVLTSVSKTLAYQVWQLLLAQGIKPYLRTRERYSGYDNAKPLFLVEWNPTGSHSKTTWWTAPDGTDYYVMPVTGSTCSPYSGPVYNCEVDEAHSYHAQGVTVANCHAGMNRGPSLAYAVLRAYHGWSPQRALDAIKNVRSVALVSYAADADKALVELGYAKKQKGADTGSFQTLTGSLLRTAGLNAKTALAPDGSTDVLVTAKDESTASLAFHTLKNEGRIEWLNALQFYVREAARKGHRRCESCGQAMRPRLHRRRDEGSRLVCDGCASNGFGATSWNVPYTATKEWNVTYASKVLPPSLLEEHQRREAASLSSLTRIAEVRKCPSCQGQGSYEDDETGRERSCTRCNGDGVLDTKTSAGVTVRPYTRVMTPMGSGVVRVDYSEMPTNAGYDVELDRDPGHTSFFPTDQVTEAKTSSLRKKAHDSGDGETIYHCGRGSERYWTIDGLKTLGETAGTVQRVLTNTGSGGVWREAMIHSFGEQSLLKVTLKRGQQTKVTYWTPEHRWLVRARQNPARAEARVVTTADLKTGDALSWLLPKSRIGTSTPSQFGIAHGITYGDGTKAALGSTLNLWGEKDAQLLRYFSESPQNIVKTAMGVLGVHVTGMPAFFKDRPSLDESIPYLYGWLAGYFAADGHVAKTGQICLDSASRESLEFVQTVAARLGIGTHDIGEKQRQGYGTEPSTIFKIVFMASTLRPDFFLIKEHRERFQGRLDRGITEKIGWVVHSVEDEGLVEEVFCPRVAEHENFVLDGWINTMNCPFCGSGQVTGGSDGSVECDFCHSAFTVQVQPTHTGFPQTVNGQPYNVPGMPGGGPDAGDSRGDQADEQGNNQDGAPAPGDSPAEDSRQGESPAEDAKKKQPNPFAKGSRRIAADQKRMEIWLQEGGEGAGEWTRASSGPLTEDVTAWGTVADRLEQQAAKYRAGADPAYPVQDVEVRSGGARYSLTEFCAYLRAGGDLSMTPREAHLIVENGVLPVDKAMAHLALKYADDKGQVLAQVRAENGRN